MSQGNIFSTASSAIGLQNAFYKERTYHLFRQDSFNQL